jgi:hypothetical protein
VWLRASLADRYGGLDIKELSRNGESKNFIELVLKNFISKGLQSAPNPLISKYLLAAMKLSTRLASCVPFSASPGRNRIGGNSMRFRTIVSLATLFVFCFAVAVWSMPDSSQASEVKTNKAAESQTVSGKISSIGDASFSVDVKKDQNTNTIQFLIDGKTVVEGKLAVGEQATVEYQSEDGQNIAKHVIIQHAATRHSR